MRDIVTKKKKYLFLILILCTIVFISINEYKKVYTNVYGTENDDLYNSAVFVNDKEFVVVGDSGDKAFIIKYDISGEIIW